jgi:hypothetical protein
VYDYYNPKKTDVKKCSVQSQWGIASFGGPRHTRPMRVDL